MVFLSNLVGLHFRLAQNRKRLKFEHDFMGTKLHKAKSKASSWADSECFDSFLSRNQSDDEMVSGISTFTQNKLNNRVV